MRFSIALLIARLINNFIQKSHLGTGSTWPGEIASLLYPSFLAEFRKRFSFSTIIIGGTNGKTTTSSLVTTALSAKALIVSNPSGANIINGLISALVANYTRFVGRHFIVVFEVDEGALPQACSQLKPEIICLLNLFRDQLDRYAELEMTYAKWRQVLDTLPPETKLLLNADDPQVASLGESTSLSVIYFGLGSEFNFPNISPKSLGDSRWCLHCGRPLNYVLSFYSHLGVWGCDFCGSHRPQPNYTCLSQSVVSLEKDDYRLSSPSDAVTIRLPLKGTYSAANVVAAYAICREFGLSSEKICGALASFTPAFGRQEKLGDVLLLLSKNPTGFTENLRLLSSSSPGPALLVLNDGVADGRDVSWIYDVSSSWLMRSLQNRTVFISGTRANELALRVRYAMPLPDFPLVVIPGIKQALKEALANVDETETLYLLPTYTAMLASRKILQGRAIL